MDVDAATIESWARDNAGEWLIMVYLDEDWNCVEYAPAWESVVDGLQGMIGVGRISMRVSKGLGVSLALSSADGLLLPTLVMFRDGQLMRSTHISSSYGSSLKPLIAKTYDFVHRHVALPSPPSSLLLSHPAATSPNTHVTEHQRTSRMLTNSMLLLRPRRIACT